MIKTLLNGKPKTLVLGLLGTILFLLAWELLSILYDFPIFPRLARIGEALWETVRSDRFPRHFMATLRIAIRGVALAGVAGVVVGSLMHEFPVVRKMVSPVILSLRGISGLALFPVIIAAFGIGDFSRIFVIFWTAWPAILINTFYGLHTVDNSMIEASQVLGTPKWRMFYRVKFPLASLDIINGLKIGLGTGWISLVAAEMLGTNTGLGFMVNQMAQMFRFPESYSYILILTFTIGVLTTLVDLFAKVVGHKLYN